MYWYKLLGCRCKVWNKSENSDLMSSSNSQVTFSYSLFLHMTLTEATSLVLYLRKCQWKLKFPHRMTPFWFEHPQQGQFEKGLQWNFLSSIYGRSNQQIIAPKETLSKNPLILPYEGFDMTKWILDYSFPWQIT